MKPPKTMTDALRKAVAASAVSLGQLSRETGVAKASLIRFARGEQSLRLDMADRLAEYFGLGPAKRKKGVKHG